MHEFRAANFTKIKKSKNVEAMIDGHDGVATSPRRARLSPSKRGEIPLTHDVEPRRRARNHTMTGRLPALQGRASTD